MDKHPHENTTRQLFKEIICIHTHTHAGLSHRKLSGTQFVEWVDDIQHVTLVKRLWVVWIALRNMSLFPAVKLILHLELLMRIGNGHRVFSCTIIQNTHERCSENILRKYRYQILKWHWRGLWSSTVLSVLRSIYYLICKSEYLLSKQKVIHLR